MWRASCKIFLKKNFILFFPKDVQNDALYEPIYAEADEVYEESKANDVFATNKSKKT